MISNATYGRIRRNLTLARAWSLYVVVFTAFVLDSVFDYNAFVFQLSSTILTILVLALTMYTTNSELQHSSQAQIKAFVSELQQVETRLESVVANLGATVRVMSELKEIMALQSAEQTEVLVQQREEAIRKVEAMKPILSMWVRIDGRKIWRFDSRHYLLTVSNSGGEVRDLWLQTTTPNSVYGPFSLASKTGSVPIKLGPVSSYNGSQVQFTASCEDVEARKYSGSETVRLAGGPVKFGLVRK